MSPRSTQAQMQQRQRIAKEHKVNAPIGGWNTISDIEDIPPTDAIIMDNYIPDIGAVRIRPGNELYVTLPGGSDVNSLFEYHDAAASGRKLFAAIDDKIYDISTIPYNDMALPTKSNNSIFDVAMMETEDSALPALQVWVNGNDKPLIFNGTDFTSRVSAYTFTPFFTGETPPGPEYAANFIGAHTFKNRMYYWADNVQDFWYTELYAIDGTLKKFPLGATGNYGGKLVAIETWTRDGGSGPDDFIVFFMASGEAIVYQGTSPEDVHNWSIVGRYNIGEPITKRAIQKYGGDILVVTTLGYIFMSELLEGVEAGGTETKIDGAAREAIRNRNNLDPFGWEVSVFPREKVLIINVPGFNASVQHVMNQSTGAWCRFTGWNAITFCEYKNVMYYASVNGEIYKAFEGNHDSGEPIYSDLQPGWIRAGGIGPKSWIAWKEFYKSTRELNLNIQFGTDYELIDGLSYPAPIEEDYVYWTNEDNVLAPGTPWSPPPPPGGTPVGDPTLADPLVEPVTYFTVEKYTGPPPPEPDHVLHWSGITQIVHGEWEAIEGHGEVISFRKRMATIQFYEMLSYKLVYEIGGRL